MKFWGSAKNLILFFTDKLIDQTTAVLLRGFIIMRRAFFQVYALLLISLVFQAGCTSSEDKEVLSLYKKEESSATEKSTPVFEWSFPNQDQNISHYEVSFRTEGPSLLSSPQVSYLTSGASVQDPSEQDLEDWFSVGLVNSYQLPPLVEKSFHYDTQYWFSVRAVNFEGEVLGEETVAWSVERVVLGFKNLETSERPKLQNGLAFHFDSEIPENFSLECYEVALGSSPGASDIWEWTDIRKEHSYQFENLKDSLDWDRSYFVSVRAVDSQKRRTVAESKRVSTSSSSVEFGSLTLSFDFNDERTPTVSWTSTLAPGYTLDHYELAIGTTSGGHDVLDWKNIGVVESYQVESSTDGISLSRDVDYYISIRAVDVNGDASGTATTEAFQITPTLIFHSLALEGVGLTFQAPLASWTVEKSDNYTLSHYEVGLGSSPETADLVGWIHIGSQTSYQLSGIDPILALFQEDYHLIVRAVSRDGSIVSASHVWRPRLTVTASLSVAGNSFSQTSSPRISIQVRRDPAVSGLYPPLYRVPLYELAVGTEPGSSDVVSWVDIGSSSEWLFRNISPKLSLQTDYYATLRLTDSNNSFMFFSTESWQVECRQGAVEVGGECTSQVSPFRFTELSIEGEFGENKAPQISWSAENTDPVDHYEVAAGTVPDGNDVLNWTRLASGSSPTIALSFIPETARYISVRAVTSGGEVLGTETSYLGYFEASETESRDANESVEVVLDKALPQGVIPELALGTSLGGSDTVDWHTVSTFSGTHRHKLVSGTNGITFNLSDYTNYYVSLRFRHNDVNYLYSSKSFRFVPPFRFIALSIESEFSENEAPQIFWEAESIAQLDQVDHYEVSIGTTSGGHDVLDWTRLVAYSHSPKITLSFVPETARYISLRAVTSWGEVLDTITSYLGYFEAREDESQDADESVEVVFDKALPEGVIPEFALGTAVGASDTVDWHAVSNFSGIHRHKLVSGTNGITFNLIEGRDYYVSMWFFHNGVNYFYVSRSFRFAPSASLTVLPDDVTDLFVSSGDANANTVWIFEQGGPVGDLENVNSLSYFPNPNIPALTAAFPKPDPLHLVAVHQALTYNNALYDRDLTQEQAEVETDVSTEILDRVIKHFKSQNKTVWVFGHSYGAYVITRYLWKKGVRAADKYIIMAGRLDMEQKAVEGFLGKRYWYFPEPDFEPVEHPTRQPETHENPSHAKQELFLLGVMGKERYTQRLDGLDLSKVIYIFANSDQATGILTSQEQSFLIQAGVSLMEIDGDHSDMFDEPH